MADSGGDNERELPATERQRERFFQSGETPRSRELIAALSLGATSVVLLAQAPAALSQLTYALVGCLRHVGQPPDAALLAHLGRTYLQMILPLGAAAVVAAFGGSVLQQRGRLNWQTPKLDLGRLDPIAGLGRLLRPRVAVGNMATSLAKVSILAAALYEVWRAQLPALVQQTPASLDRGLKDAGHLLLAVLVRGLWTLLALGAFDYAVAFWRLERKMRMSAQQIRDESKESAGDPSVRHRRRRAHRALVRARSLKDVPRADVVVVNPTHVAVAIQYAAGSMPAPRLLAKGQDGQAERLRQIARAHQIPIVSQPPLARLLYAQVKVGAFVPAEMYRAVAVVLAHVYNLKKRGSAR